MAFDIDSALVHLVEAGGSDLHIKVPSTPMMRVDGDLRPVEGLAPLTREDTEGALAHLLTDEAKRREFAEELGLQAPTAGFVELGDVTQSGGKIVTAWAVETDVDLDDFAPGTFELEWPPRSGRVQTFPEIDRIAWVGPVDAHRLLVTAQTAFVDRLTAHLA